MDLLSGRAGYGEVIYRDLSSNLDVIPSGGGVGGELSLADILAALATAYGYVVLHASDWRAPVARVAAEAADVAVVIAPEAKLPRAIEEASAAMGESCSQFIGFAEKRPKTAREEEIA